MNKEWVFEGIQVESYAGYKEEETPRAFTHLGQRHEIHEIMDRWYEEKQDPRAPRQNYFKVKTTAGEVFLLRYTPRFQSWTVCRSADLPTG